MQLAAGARDTLTLMMPRWSPGYYQLLDYASGVEGFSVVDDSGNQLPFIREPEYRWQITNVRGKNLSIQYAIQTRRKFVASSYADSAHAYIVGGNSFLYVKDHLHLAANVQIEVPKGWKVATGLSQQEPGSTTYLATDFDQLYDSPILMGELEELSSFQVDGIEHRFIGYQIGDFDRNGFIDKLKRVVTASSDVIGDIPYDSYTFIAIGPGRGGIEHLNNTTISFDGNGLDEPENLNRMLKFLAHEHFHHYNVKRIRPIDLGPFDYENGSKTNLLGVSEGFTVYFEYLILKRAGLIDENSLLSDIEREINVLQSNPGRQVQTLKQASYGTWHDGPFGEPGKTISVYNKGAVFGLILDFAIRQTTKSQKSLDDVMRQAYHRFYKTLGRGFTDVEFQLLCEEIAGTRLTDVFDYIYSTKEIDYATYLGYAGLKLVEVDRDESGPYRLEKVKKPSSEQEVFFRSWLRD